MGVEIKLGQTLLGLWGEIIRQLQSYKLDWRFENTSLEENNWKLLLYGMKSMKYPEDEFEKHFRCCWPKENTTLVLLQWIPPFIYARCQAQLIIIYPESPAIQCH